MSMVAAGPSSSLSQEGAVDNFEDKKDDHSTRKHPYNTESRQIADCISELVLDVRPKQTDCPSVGDSIEDKNDDDHSTGKRPETSQFKQIAAVYAKLVEDAHRYDSDGHPVRNLPADFLAKKKRELRGCTSSSLDSFPKGYGMICKVCWVPNCRTGRYNIPMSMNCCYCNERGKHFPYDCPSY